MIRTWGVDFGACIDEESDDVEVASEGRCLERRLSVPASWGLVWVRALGEEGGGGAGVALPGGELEGGEGVVGGVLVVWVVGEVDAWNGHGGSPGVWMR